jgi:plasmid stabilization system protein ParE
MPRGSKDKYTDKQKRKAQHIEESYEQRGVSEGEAERRAWATVNEQDGGGREGGRLASSSRGRRTARKKGSSGSTGTRSRSSGTSRRKSAKKKTGGSSSRGAGRKTAARKR